MLLIALAIVLMLRVQEVRHVQDDMNRMMPHLEEQGVEKTVMRRRGALRRIEELEALCEAPAEAENRIPWLKQVAAEAASWAAGAPAPSGELTAAVNIRAAADALRAYGVRANDQSLHRAKTKLSEARAALADNAKPGTATDGLKDRLENLEQSQREHFQELEEAL